VPWKIPQNNRNIAQPIVVGTNRFILSAGYGGGSAAMELSHSNGGWAAREIWRNRQLKNKFTSSVLWDGYVYGLDENTLACIDAASGERKWREGKYEYGQVVLAFAAGSARDAGPGISDVRSGLPVLIVLGGNGSLAFVKADPSSWIELDRFEALPGKTWNHPALANGLLLVRNAVEMACYDLRPRPVAKP
jgi:outer membrane protein assembly factor BamB